MVRVISENGFANRGSMPLAVGFFLSVSALVALCVKHTRRRLLKCKNKAITDVKYESKSPLASPKHLLTSISSKAMPFISRKKDSGDDADAKNEAKQVGFGEDGLWKKAILMGEKCKLPEFSGVIFYDSFGNQLHEPPPRSPRASPLSKLTLPAVVNIEK